MNNIQLNDLNKISNNQGNHFYLYQTKQGIRALQKGTIFQRKLNLLTLLIKFNEELQNIKSLTEDEVVKFAKYQTILTAMLKSKKDKITKYGNTIAKIRNFVSRLLNQLFYKKSQTSLEFGIQEVLPKIKALIDNPKKLSEKSDSTSSASSSSLLSDSSTFSSSSNISSNLTSSLSSETPLSTSSSSSLISSNLTSSLSSETPLSTFSSSSNISSKLTSSLSSETPLSTFSSSSNISSNLTSSLSSETPLSTSSSSSLISSDNVTASTEATLSNEESIVDQHSNKQENNGSESPKLAHFDRPKLIGQRLPNKIKKFTQDEITLNENSDSTNVDYLNENAPLAKEFVNYAYKTDKNETIYHYIIQWLSREDLSFEGAIYMLNKAKDFGINVNEFTNLGFTVLHYAISILKDHPHQLDIVKHLIEVCEANPKIAGEGQKNALLFAMSKKIENNLVKFLAEQFTKEELNTFVKFTNKGRTVTLLPLSFAILQKEPECYEYYKILRNAGASDTIFNKSGFNSFYFLVKKATEFVDIKEFITPANLKPCPDIDIPPQSARDLIIQKFNNEKEIESIISSQIKSQINNIFENLDETSTEIQNVIHVGNIDDLNKTTTETVQ